MAWTRFAREYKLGPRYYRVEVADYDQFVPSPSPGVEIILRPSWWSVRLQGKKRTREACLSWGRQALFSARYSRTLWGNEKGRL